MTGKKQLVLPASLQLRVSNSISMWMQVNIGLYPIVKKQGE